MNLSAFIECSTGRTPNNETIKRYIKYLSAFGYDTIYLGLTDGFKLDDEPYFNYNRGGYTLQDLQQLDDFAQKCGIQLRASIQTLAHLGSNSKYKSFSDIFDTSDILLVGEEKTYAFIDEIFNFFSKALSSKVLHIGMDEAFSLGSGKYKQLHGERNKEDIFLEHLSKVAEIAQKYGFQLEIWSDMFFRMVSGSDYGDKNGVVPQNIKDKIPSGVKLYYWQYICIDENELSYQLEQNKTVCDDVGFAGTVWTIFGAAPFNRISAEHLIKQFDICKKNGINDFMITLWTDCTLCDPLSALPALFQVAEYAKNGENVLSKAKFKEVTGISFDDFMLVDYINDPFIKNSETYSLRSLTILFSDLFYGYFDEGFSAETAEKYRLLRQKLGKVKSKEFSLLFKQFESLSLLLGEKIELGRKIRLNYKKKDKTALLQIVESDLPFLIKLYRKFLSDFEKCWLDSYMPQGLECNQIYLGGIIERLNYVKKSLRNFITKDIPINELERDYLPRDDNFTEDNIWYTDIREIMSFCRFY